MTTVQEFADTFPSEAVLQQALAKLLSKIPGHTGVQILQGSHEIGKDIIFYTPGAFGQRDLNACVVKNTKITSSASSTAGARTVFGENRGQTYPNLRPKMGISNLLRVADTPHSFFPQTSTKINPILVTNNLY